MSRLKSSNPFEDDEADDDFVMVNKPKQSASGKTGGGLNRNNLYSDQGRGWNVSGDQNPFDDRRENIQRQIDNSENNQLESTQRALASIYESEAMGIATAEELLRQKETLDRIENKTTGIQSTLKTSQKHLNSIKSVFGGFKNWWKGDKSNTEDEATTASSSRLRDIVDQSEKHVERERPRADYTGFFEDNDNDLDAKFMAKAPKASSPTGGYSMISPVTRSAREEELDNNLGMMSDGMSRLKSLAIGLGDEIEQQNEQLPRIILKVENADDLVTHQNSQMRKILKK